MLEEQHDFKYEGTMQTIENNLDDANMGNQDNVTESNLPCDNNI